MSRGGRKEGRMRRWQHCGSVGRQKPKRVRGGRDGPRRSDREGREGRMKGPTGMERRRGPAWSRQSAISLWHLNLRWPGRDCLSGTGDITGVLTYDLSPPHCYHSPHHPFSHFSCFPFLISFQLSLDALHQQLKYPSLYNSFIVSNCKLI